MHGDLITTFNEKMETPPTNIINAGCYIFNRTVIDEIPAGRVVSVERETFPSLLARNARVAGFIDNSYWLDIGNPGALLKATRDLIEASGHQMAQGRGSTIDPSAVVDEGSYVGAQATVGAGSELHQCIIGEGARVGANVRLTRTFVAAGTKIEPNTLATDEFLGFSSE
jgi:mannose-1-phosphate guanylyltransferase